MDIVAAWLIDCLFPFCRIEVCTVCKSQADFIGLGPRSSVNHTIYLYYYFLVSRPGVGSRQSPYTFFLFVYIWSREMFIGRAMCGLTHVKVAALCSIFRLSKYLYRWRIALNEAGHQWVLMAIKRPTILRTELNTFHLQQLYPLFMHNKLQYSWRGDYCSVCGLPKSPS
jgi:hypothetical protein